MINKRQMLDLLNEEVKKCLRCDELAQKRKQTVFGQGNPDANLLILGWCPGTNEDDQGIPFCGASGELLDNMIKACGFTREELYICNTIACHPPHNRVPHPCEINNCKKFKDLQIKIVNPNYILCLGTVAAQHLLDTNIPVSHLRGSVHDYLDKKVIVTYHPSYALREGEHVKNQIKADLLLLLKTMQKIP